ncbi:MAG: alpha/beta hydrolase, partial [Candidatus Dadabacteria bacterium]
MSFLRTLTLVISCITLLMSASLVLRFRWSRGGPLLWIFKSFSAALSPYTGIVAGICALTAMVTGSAATILISGTSVIISLVYLAGISAAPSRRTGFQSAFGPLWKERVVSKSSFLKRPATLLLPSDKKFILKRDIPYGSVEGTNRQLLCDLWLPSREVKPSGIAFIYLHGSAWCYLDKDTGTRTFFRHLASQGHVIMDVAYRLFPETDMTGMVQDAKRAIAWMKANAAGCHVNPHKVII